MTDVSNLKKFSTRPRAFHIVDIENLAWNDETGATAPHLDPARVRQVWSLYASVASLGVEDAVLVGCGRGSAPSVVFAVPAGHQLVIGRYGKDAADEAILAALDVELLARRYQRVVIASGDHVFTPLARNLEGRGVEVVNVARGPETQAYTLRSASTHSLYIEGTYVPAPAAA